MIFVFLYFLQFLAASPISHDAVVANETQPVCCICLDELPVGVKLDELFHCNHTDFHPKCITDHFIASKCGQCPLCRAPHKQLPAFLDKIRIYKTMTTLAAQMLAQQAIRRGDVQALDSLYSSHPRLFRFTADYLIESLLFKQLVVSERLIVLARFSRHTASNLEFCVELVLKVPHRSMV